jgi:lipopolysaccharide export LptBFGC system permease protein LptF
MSKTLFWYIFLDLLKIFGLTNGALSGVMSFGGLVRPLTKQGLGISEVASLILHLLPAMSTYSLPIAALFATTLVYGKLASDNEIVAMRAGGISHLAIALPGIVLGLIVCVLSLALLFFIVPVHTLQAEKVVYSNVARLLATSIERTHEFELGSTGAVLSAQGARIVAAGDNDPNRQTVVLDSPLIINSEVVRGPQGKMRVPKEFYTARQATVHISSVPSSDEVEVVAQLEQGISFPRRFNKAVTGGIEATQFGPARIPSQLAEKVKFMDLRKLWDLRDDPDLSSRVQKAARECNRRQQQRIILAEIQRQLTRSGMAVFRSTGFGNGGGAGGGAGGRGGGGEIYVLSAPNGATISPPGATLERELVLTAAPPPSPGTGKRKAEIDNSVIRFETSRSERTVLTVDAQRITLKPLPDDASQSIQFDLVFENAVVRAGSSAALAPDTAAPRANASTDDELPDDASVRDRFKRSFTIAMWPEVANLGSRTAAQQRTDPTLPPELRNELLHSLVQTTHDVIGELNARCAFAVSCLILVLIGVSLGMMFKSGHFLSAFALSVIPALLCILLTNTGQHVLENVPGIIPPTGVSMTFGLTMIWIGNATVLLVASALLFRLQRQ